MAIDRPEQINQLFVRAMRAGDLEAALALYDADVAFANRAGEVRRGLAALREELAPFAAARAAFVFTVKKVIEAGDTALVHNLWQVDTPEPRRGHAIEVARRQADGTWRWLIGDPFTVAADGDQA